MEVMAIGRGLKPMTATCQGENWENNTLISCSSYSLLSCQCLSLAKPNQKPDGTEAQWWCSAYRWVYQARVHLEGPCIVLRKHLYLKDAVYLFLHALPFTYLMPALHSVLSLNVTNSGKKSFSIYSSLIHVSLLPALKHPLLVFLYAY